jgi:DNA polymerase I-like protein with 3'-5' exonuclease and polymerase domains
MSAITYTTQLPADLFPDKSWLAIDIETTGLDVVTDAIVCVAVSDGTDAVVVDLRNHAEDTIREWVMRSIFSRRLILHNAAFDLAFLQQKYDCGYPSTVVDTWLAEGLLRAGLEWSTSLKETAQRRLGLVLDKELQTSFTLGPDPLSPEQVEYAGYDVIPLPEIARQQYRELRSEGLKDVWHIECQALPAFAEMMRRGVAVNVPRITKLIEEARDERDRLATTLQARFTPHILHQKIAKFDAKQEAFEAYLRQVENATNYYAAVWERDLAAGAVYDWEDAWLDQSIDKKDGQPKGRKRFVRAHMQQWRKDNPRPERPKLDEEPINLNAPEQLKEALVAEGINIQNVQAKTLYTALATADDEIRTSVLLPLLAYKKKQKLVTAFGEPVIRRIGPDGRLRATFRQIGTATGRPSCSNPNLLQMPSAKIDPRYRSCFIAGEGMVLVVADYAQMEYRLLAELSGDELMLATFLAGDDLHSVTAHSLFGTVTEENRKVAKIINFSIMYGAGPGSVQRTLAEGGIFYSFLQAKDLLQSWRDTFPDADEWLREQGQKAAEHSFAATPLGRKRYFPLEPPSDYDHKTWNATVKRRGANHVIQGCNADITKIAMGRIQDDLWPEGSILIQVYDEIVCEVPHEIGGWAAERVRQRMIEAANSVFKRLPPAVDVVVSSSWNEKDVVDVSPDLIVEGE